MIAAIKHSITHIYQHRSYIYQKKAVYFFHFSMMMILISIVGMIFHENLKDFIMYLFMFLYFAGAMIFLLKGSLEKAVDLIIFILPVIILSDILRFEFTSYEKIVETLMESFLSYLAVGLFSIKKEHIIYTVAANTCLTLLHAFLIFHYTYPHFTLPAAGYKYLIGGCLAVLLTGLIVVYNFKVNEESFRIVQRSKEEMEELIYQRTRDLEKVNRELERTNMELCRLSSTDPLTGVYNRRKVLDEAADMVSSRVKDGGPMAIIMLDIDHFKGVNDSYGHAAGDLAIQTMVEVCRSQLREGDCIGRMGGEEFLLVLDRTHRIQAIALLGQIRARMAETVIHSPKGVPFHITISAGISYLQRNESLEELIDQADEALYQSKRDGRNRITILT